MTPSRPEQQAAQPVPCDEVLAIRQLTVVLGRRTVLHDLDLSLAVGTSAAVVGPSGAGKSTLLSAVLGLLRPRSGTIMVCGHRVRAGAGRRTASIRRSHIGMVFQDGYLIDELSAVENVIVPALLAGTSHREAVSRARSLLADLGLADDDRAVSSFSGGERQRVALARALVNSPQLLIADEPTGSLDPDNRDRVIAALAGTARQQGCAVLLVTHDPVVAAHTDRVLRLEDGRLTPVAPSLAGGAR